MFVQIAFSAESFERLIKYRIADLYRPLPTPVASPKNSKSWFDGMLVTHIDFNRIENDRFVVVNERDPGGAVVPNAFGSGYNAGALSMNLAAEFYFVSASDVAIAGLAQPPIETVQIPVGPLPMVIRARVGADGIPMLDMSLDTAGLASLGLPGEVVASIGSAANASFPFDIAGQLKDIFPAGNDRVLNAGITRDDGGAIVLRFEFAGQPTQSPATHVHDWQTFFSASFQANLGDNDWCIDLDGGAVAGGLMTTIDPSFKNNAPIVFDSSPSSQFVDDDTPRVVVRKHGYVQSACDGDNLGFEAFAILDLSVPSDNLLRGTLTFAINKDAGDVVKCIANILLDPIAVFRTAADNGEPGLGFAEFALSYVFPTKAIIALSAIGMLFVGVDKAAANKIIADRLKENPKVTKLPGGGFAFDRALAPKSALTKDWLVLKKCTGANGRMLLTGELGVPDAVLPRLTAVDLDGLSKWGMIDKCDPGKGQVSEGSLTLTLTPGHGAAAARVQPVKVPTVSLKWGVRPDGGNLVFEVLKDTLGIYQDPMSEYREIYVPGIPGVVEATLKASTVRKKAFEGFADAPYALRLRFHTNGGVREYEFAAPPKLRAVVETIPKAVARINNCKHRGSSLVLHRFLSLLWLKDPSPELGSEAQQWEVHVRGLTPARMATVWNQSTGAPLARAFANQAGRMDIALVLPNGHRADALLITLDDEPFRTAAQMRREPRPHAHNGSAAAAEVAVRQTVLTEIEHLDFTDPIDTLSLADAGTQSTLVVHTVRGERINHTIPSPYNAGLATLASDAAITVAQQTPTTQGQLAWRGGERLFMILSQRPGRTEVLAEYSARSSYDLGASREDLFAQVSGDGRRLTLFQKGAPLQLGSYEWVDNAPDAKSYDRTERYEVESH
jgi:hypothetical protein